MKATLNPAVIIEVLSNSTEHLDKTHKTRCYKDILRVGDCDLPLPEVYRRISFGDRLPGGLEPGGQ